MSLAYLVIIVLVHLVFLTFVVFIFIFILLLHLFLYRDFAFAFGDGWSRGGGYVIPTAITRHFVEHGATIMNGTYTEETGLSAEVASVDIAFRLR
jgi:hypothetical protein